MSVTPGLSGLLRLGPAHVSGVAEAVVQAFALDPVWAAMFPDPAERTRCTRALFTFMLRYGIMQGEVWAPSNRLEGAAVWLPGRSADVGGMAAVRCGALSLPFRIGFGRMRRFATLGSTITAVRSRNVPEHYRYLAMLGIGPDYQGRGLGTDLLKPVLERSDREALPIWLETETERNVAFYQRLGFETRAEFIVPALEVKMWGMLRPPAARDHMT